MAFYLTIEEIREELQDRTPADNSIDLDQAFTDEEIIHAMKRAAAAYNALSPVGIDIVSWKCLPSGTSVFMDGVVSQIYKSQIHRLARNQMTWQTGDTTVEFEKTRMQAFQGLQQQAESAFKEAASARKQEINRSLCYGMF